MNYKQAILINDTSGESHLGCDNVIRNIKLLCKKNGMEVIRTLTRQDINNRRNLHRIKDCDIIVVNGEGTLHDGWGRDWLTKFIKLIPKDKKAVLINSVWHNMGKIKGLDKFSLISVRELNSFESIVKDYPRPDKIWVVPDVIFYTEVPKKIHIGYGDSNNGSITDKLNKHGNYFPLHYKRIGTFKYPGVLKAQDLKSYHKWLKSLDLHITGRFHGVCLSAMAGAPFLAFESNARKIEGILRDMNCSELLIKNLDEVEKKKELAIELIPKAYLYAVASKTKIEDLFKTIKEIAYEK